LIEIGIIAAVKASHILWQRAKRGGHAENLGVHLWTTVLGWIPAVALPILFAIAWIGMWLA